MVSKGPPLPNLVRVAYTPSPIYSIETTPLLILIGPYILLNIFGFQGRTAAKLGVGNLCGEPIHQALVHPW